MIGIELLKLFFVCDFYVKLFLQYGYIELQF